METEESSNTRSVAWRIKRQSSVKLPLSMYGRQAYPHCSRLARIENGSFFQFCWVCVRVSERACTWAPACNTHIYRSALPFAPSVRVTVCLCACVHIFRFPNNLMVQLHAILRMVEYFLVLMWPLLVFLGFLILFLLLFVVVSNFFSPLSVYFFLCTILFTLLTWFRQTSTLSPNLCDTLS